MMPTPAMGRTTQAHLTRLCEAFAARHRRAAAETPGWLVADPAGAQADRLLAELELYVEAEKGIVVAGAWRKNLVRPFGGLAELAGQLAESVLAHQPELLRRYRLTLGNLLPTGSRFASLHKGRRLQSGLARFVLFGDTTGLRDFYWRRDETPLLTAELIYFILDAADVLTRRVGVPLLIRLDDLHLADDRSLGAVELLGRYAREAPLLICATTGGPIGGRLEASWQLLGWDAPESSGDADGWLDTGPSATPEGRWIAQTASVLALPFQGTAGLRWSPEPWEGDVEGRFQDLLRCRVLRRVGDTRFALASSRLRDAAYRSLDPERRRQLHAGALLEEKDDPFAATWHVHAAGFANDSPLLLRAIEQAWAVSDFEGVLALGQRDLGPGGATIDRNVLFGCAHYGAGRHVETDRHLSLAMQHRQPGSVGYNTLKQLLGYNAVFGLGDFDRGRDLLESVLHVYEQEDRREAGFLRNSVAFALFRTGRLEDAIAAERLALELLQNASRADGFLLSILLLNLGRLYRSLGFLDRALDLFRTVIGRGGAQHSPQLLLLLYTSLAYLEVLRGRPAEAMKALLSCLELARDLDLESVGDPMLGLLSRPFRIQLAGELTRGAQVLSLLYLNLAALSDQLGLGERSAAYLAGLQWLGKPLAEDARRTLMAAVALKQPAAASAPQPFSDPEEDTASLEDRYPDLVCEPAQGSTLVAAVVEALAGQRAVAIVRPRQVGPGIFPVDSLVLFDPRVRRISELLNLELGASSGALPPASGYAPDTARAALLLPEELDRFSDGPAVLPLVQQEASFRPELQSALPALTPFHLRLQVLSPELDGFLYELLRGFADRTGIGIVGVMPFRLRRRNLALTSEEALFTFLASSVDHLVLADRLLSKRHGAAAPKNLLRLCPRLSQHAVIDRGSAADETEGTFRLWLRMAFETSCLRLRSELLPLLELCDGRRTTSEIIEQMRYRLPAGPDSEESLCRLLKKLVFQGALDFEKQVDRDV